MQHRFVALTLALLVLAVVPVVGTGPATIALDDLSDGDAVGTHYPGLAFSPSTILTSGLSLNEFEYPPHSGANVVTGANGVLTIQFATPTGRFSGYFTYTAAVTVQGFDATGALVGTATSHFANNLALSGDVGSTPNDFVEATFTRGAVEVRVTQVGTASFTLDDIGMDILAGAPVFTTPPTDQQVTAGQTAQFTAVASGTPDPTYQWQGSSDNGTTWGNVTEGAPYSGTTLGTLTITSAPVTLTGARYRAVASNSVSVATSSGAVLRVFGGMSPSPTTLRFNGTKPPGSATFTTVTPPQAVTVTFAGAGSTWTATVDQPWVQLTNATGSSTGSFTAQIVNPGDVIGASTDLTATITVSAPTAVNPTVTIPVQLRVITVATGLPFGSFDTPVSGGGISGSIAVTGWALDDVGIDRVEIWRDPVAGETTVPYCCDGPGNGKIFIARPLFISGSRPDVEAAYPSFPLSTRSGWGYLLLTQGLWNQGNDTYTLYAFAFDQEGNATTLATKTITVDNAHAVKPFGALDTPSYGQTVTGSFWNYGWALTPNPHSADPRTCTITNGNVQVGIDSGPAMPVNYGDLRDDIAASFPGFSNGNNAGGAFYIDTSTLSNGVHQIGWLVTDNCGRQDGIGSRFFGVLGNSLTAEP